jgi:hypothetical protein
VYTISSPTRVPPIYDVAYLETLEISYSRDGRAKYKHARLSIKNQGRKVLKYCFIFLLLCKSYCRLPTFHAELAMKLDSGWEGRVLLL